jgi:hypothetical protein
VLMGVLAGVIVDLFSTGGTAGAAGTSTLAA